MTAYLLELVLTADTCSFAVLSLTRRRRTRSPVKDNTRAASPRQLALADDEGRCENNNLSRMLVCVCASTAEDDNARTHCFNPGR